MPPAPSPHRDMVESAVFIHYLRTGYRPDVEELLALVERKFNPYHDQIGRFTSPPGATVSYGASLTARAASNSNDIGGHGARRTQTGPSRRNGESVPSRSRGSLNGFRSALVRDAVSPTTSNADSYFELNKRQAHLDHLRREVGPIPDPAVFADLEDFQRRLNANRQLLDDRARIADRQVNEILRAGLAPYNVASGAISIASGNGELRDYLSVAEVIPVAGTVGRLGKIACESACNIDPGSGVIGVQN